MKAESDLVWSWEVKRFGNFLTLLPKLKLFLGSKLCSSGGWARYRVHNPNASTASEPPTSRAVPR